ncbi:phytoene synthase [Flavobacterium akiainvivens]|uniref:Phytoene synthase n=1 Tax=Flavobacterium akiainvivens TaxID=1202724 RepID=A0A0M9VIF9_9FLAO|nr:phytoene/squalene synthase family protein [Flavobacterium akiainvivens]KOS06569.1 phytoene synthase [Flavobacterium akiainvivens]SFQ10279.1 Phytoene/squalene synthetase [Flavobacterium akiainvivens]
MKALFDTVSYDCSRNITRSYSTSFSMGIYLLAPHMRSAIYSIYGFVRLADEVVDSFEGYNQKEMLSELKVDTFKALRDRISLNPVLNSFQHTVLQYNIEYELIEAFLESMEMDLEKQLYTNSLYEKYIYGSAEVVGLMCLKVFCNGNKDQYDALEEPARKLGAAFQKINFLRDFKADNLDLGRTYFPGVDFDAFTEPDKLAIEADIEKDFNDALEGIKKLPKEARFGVFLAYIYYKALFRKIRKLPSHRIMQERIRVPNTQKFALLVGCYLRNGVNMI